MALGQRLAQDVLALAHGRRPAALLVGVHPLVGDPQRAPAALSASSGTSTEPNEQPTANPSPRSVSAAPALATVAATSPSAADATMQNSSPPRR